MHMCLSTTSGRSCWLQGRRMPCFSSILSKPGQRAPPSCPGLAVLMPCTAAGQVPFKTLQSALCYPGAACMHQCYPLLQPGLALHNRWRWQSLSRRTARHDNTLVLICKPGKASSSCFFVSRVHKPVSAAGTQAGITSIQGGTVQRKGVQVPRTLDALTERCQVLSQQLQAQVGPVHRDCVGPRALQLYPTHDRA